MCAPLVVLQAAGVHSGGCTQGAVCWILSCLGAIAFESDTCLPLGRPEAGLEISPELFCIGSSNR